MREVRRAAMRDRRFPGGIANWAGNLLLVGLLCVTAAPGAAQACWAPMPCRPDHEPVDSHRSGHLVALGINAALGGLTAGVRQHTSGGSFWRGVLYGAVGGGAVYAGKWLSVEPFWGAGIAGRQVAAVGASVIRNASDDRPVLDQIMVPVGPVRAYVDRGETPSLRLKLDLLGAAVSAYHGVSSGSRFDPIASLSAGTPVFHTRTPWFPGWHGNNTAGVIVLLHEGITPHPDMAPETVFAHERVHLLQYDQVTHTWGSPLEQWLLRRVPGGEWIAKHADLGLILVPVVLINHVVPYEARPWEREAHLLSGS